MLKKNFFLKLSALGLLFMLNISVAFAANGISQSISLLDDDDDGDIETIQFEIDNDALDSWSLTGLVPYGLSVTQGGNVVDIDSVAILSAPTADPVVIEVVLDENDADFVETTDGVNENVIELTYNQETGDNTCTVSCIKDDNDNELNSITTGDTGGTDTEEDNALPVVLEVTFTQYEAVGTNFLRNSIVLRYSEDMQISPNSGTTFLSGDTRNGSTATLAQMDTARTLEGIGEWDGPTDLTVGSAANSNYVYIDGNEIEVRLLENGIASGYFDAGTVGPTENNVGSFTPYAVVNTVKDFNDNAVNTSAPDPTLSFKEEDGTVITDGDTSPWNATAPTILNLYSCDRDDDGDVDQLLAEFSEDMNLNNASNITEEGDNDSTNDGVGEFSPSNTSESTFGCDNGVEDDDENDNKYSFLFDPGISGTDKAYLHITANTSLFDHAGNLLAIGDALGTEVDKAAPVAMTGLDADAGGEEEVDLTWDAVDPDDDDFGTFKVYYSNATGVNTGGTLWGSGDDADLNTEGTTSTTVTGLIPGQPYFFVIYHEDAAGNLSQISNEVFVRTEGGGGLSLLGSIGGSGSGGGTVTTTTNSDGTVTEILTFGDCSVNLAPAFTDISGADYKDDIEVLRQHGIVHGREPGKYVPASNVNRAEFVKMTMTRCGESPYPGATTFPDVKSNEWYAPYVDEAEEKKVVTGYNDGEFKPANLVTRVEAIAILTRFFGVSTSVNVDALTPDVQQGDWYASYASFALENDLLPVDNDGNFNPHQPITRDEAAHLVVEIAMVAVGT